MSDTVIKVENLSKQYRIGGANEGYRTFRETLVDAVKAPFQRLGRALSMAHRAWSKSINSKLPAPRSQLSAPSSMHAEGTSALSAPRSMHAEDTSSLPAPGSSLSSTDDTIWALKDVSFEVKRGEVVGIIGRNGAGKSTLLKILSKITEPTEGRVELRGRVGSLLEVGTGFHPELTGHENVYLYGAILGMDRWEVTRKFDEIVAFAELEKFIETPVKRYSSGMYMRLAFAVAAHLETEILLVDEVLAVGDTAFQKKCLGKMEDVASRGRTILFVSHNMGAVSALCDTVIYLDTGRLTKIGQTSEIINAYMESLQISSKSSLRERTDRSGTGKAKITSVYFSTTEGIPIHKPISGFECMLVMGYESLEPLSRPTFKFTIYNSIGQAITHFDSSLNENTLKSLQRQGFVACRLGRLPLSEGAYRLNVSVEEGIEILDHVIGAHSFIVEQGNFYGTGRNIKGLREVCLSDQEWLVLK